MASAAYSPDGKWIVFAKGVDGNEPDVYVMKADGSAERRITKSRSGKAGRPGGPNARYERVHMTATPDARVLRSLPRFPLRVVLPSLAA
jgi:Tol biopolymer transport system component